MARVVRAGAEASMDTITKPGACRRKRSRMEWRCSMRNWLVEEADGGLESNCDYRAAN